MNKPLGTITRYLLMTYMVMSLSTCEDPFNPDLSDIESENELVVEGFISNGEGPHQVRLSRTVAIQSNSNSPAELGALVQVIDQDGNVHTLDETENGIYLTNEANFQAQVGNAYQLRIELSTGETYESDYQELIPVPPIDTLYHRIRTTEEVVETIIRQNQVVSLFTDYEPHDETAYYRYDYVTTYAFRSELQGQEICWAPNGTPPANLSPSTLCYVTEAGGLRLNVSSYPDPINGATGSANLFDMDLDVRFRLDMSLLVKKYSLTKEYHDFLVSVREQGSFGGSIFDSPPTQIIGNIRSVDDPDRYALGYFSTLAETTKRIFIPSQGGQRASGRCTIPEPPLFFPPPTDCCDCRNKPGASTIRPTFWMD